MSLADEKQIDRQILVILGILCVLIIFTIYYVEHREINDAYSLAGRIIDTSKDVDSYQFDIHSNISMLGESFALMKGNGSVDYTNKRMSIHLRSMEDSLDMIMVDDNAYSRSNDETWKKQKLSQQTWDKYDQLTQTDMLLTNSTNLSMERTNLYLILTALPDNEALLLKLKELAFNSKEMNISKNTV